VSRKIFSKEFRTFGGWLKAQPRKSEYARRIIRFHERFPNMSLNELRNARHIDYNLSTAQWLNLTSQQKRDRNLSLQILRSMRKGGSLTETVEKLGVNKDFAVKHLGKYLTKSRGKWRVTQTDRIEAEMLIYDRNHGQISIITTNSKDRSLIGKYFSSVQKALKNNDPSVLNKFKDRKIIDSEGKEHFFETDLERLYEITDAQEEPEFLEIYQH
jgi:hypothetical protein